MDVDGTSSAHLERVVAHGVDGLSRASERLRALRGLARRDLSIPDAVALSSSGDVVARVPALAGIDLESLARLRGGLPLGELISVGVGVADALAALHSVELSHGDITPANVLVVAGRVVLVDLLGACDPGRSTPGFADPIAANRAGVHGDLYGLGATLRAIAAPNAATVIKAWTEPMMTSDLTRRATARDVTRALPHCTEPSPITVPQRGIAEDVRLRAAAVVRTERTREGRRWRVRRRIVRSAIVTTAVVIVGAGLGLVSERTPTAPQAADIATSEPGVMSPPDVAARNLTIARVAALARGDGPGLLATTAEGSAARLADNDLARRLGTDVTFTELGVTVLSATTRSLSPTQSRVVVTYVLSPHRRHDGGRLEQQLESRERVELTLVTTAEGWKVAQALPAT